MADEIKIMSFNVRFDNPDEAPDDKWAVRKSAVIDIINKYKPALLGLQEPHQNQVDELDQALGDYKWLGRGRYVVLFGINEQHNELNPIYYDFNVLTKEATGTFWYSDTPDVPNTQWACSAFPRIATWARFTVTGTDKRLCFINTHFDHESEQARTQAAELLLKMIPTVSQGLPTIVCGDLNCGEESPAVLKLKEELTEASSSIGCDCCEVIPGCLGKVGTFVGFDKSIDSQIDFIFANKGFVIKGYGTIPDERDNGRCCSDHRPIMATLSWNPDFVVVAPPAPAAPEAAPGAADAAIAGANETAAAAAAQAEQAAKQAADEAARMVNAAAEKAANALSSLFKGL